MELPLGCKVTIGPHEITSEEHQTGPISAVIKDTRCQICINPFHLKMYRNLDFTVDSFLDRLQDTTKFWKLVEDRIAGIFYIIPFFRAIFLH